MQLSICSYRGHCIIPQRNDIRKRSAVVTSRLLPESGTSIVGGNSVRETLVKRRNKEVQEITRSIENVFSFYAVIEIEHGFQCINIHQVPRKMLKTPGCGLGFQHFCRDLANVNARKTMFVPYINNVNCHLMI